METDQCHPNSKRSDVLLCCQLYRPISITSVLSKEFERLVSVRIGVSFTLLCVSHTLQSTLESRQEAIIVQIDFNAAFDRVSHRGILYKLCSVDIEGSV